MKIYYNKKEIDLTKLLRLLKGAGIKIRKAPNNDIALSNALKNLISAIDSTHVEYLEMYRKIKITDSNFALTSL